MKRVGIWPQTLDRGGILFSKSIGMTLAITPK